LSNARDDGGNAFSLAKISLALSLSLHSGATPPTLKDVSSFALIFASYPPIIFSTIISRRLYARL
jgi:hypothetical protein